MREEIRTYYCDSEFGIEVCHFQQIKHDFPIHFHEYYIVGVIENDCRETPWEEREILMELVYDKKPHPLRAGDILLCNPYDCHSCRHLGNGYYSYYNVAIRPDVMRNVLQCIRGREALPDFSRQVIQNDELQCLVREMYEAVKGNEGRFLKEELLFSIVDTLFEQNAGQGDEWEETGVSLDCICAYIEEHFDSHMDLDMLGGMFGYSKYHLIRVFSREKGISPHGYLESIRIKRAKLLLREGCAPGIAAQKTGYYDQSHFTKVFKRIVGLTPRQFIRYNRKPLPRI